MHILLTDVLTCPRCGPRFGLIVLADEMADRHVRSGSLGCANCRNTYPVQGGVADLRVHPGEGVAAAAVDFDAERAFRLAALTGVANRPASVVVTGVPPAAVAEVARLLPAAQVIGASRTPPTEVLPGGVSWIVREGALPFRAGALLAVAVVGPGAALTPADIEGSLAVQGRLVLDGVEGRTVAELRSGGWALHLEQEGVAVASRLERG